MDSKSITDLLQDHSIRPTPNRMIIADTLSHATGPMSLMELEAEIGSIDKSNVFRALTLFRERHLVHVLESVDGVRYELCHSHGPDDEDAHVHFECERCGKTYCLEDIPIPKVIVPSDYTPLTVNYIIKGVCPKCKSI